MVYLPIELLTEVARRVGHNGFRGLAGFISGGTNGRDTAFDNKVLVEVDLDEFIFVSSLANEGSLYRPFFMKCFTAGNMTAKYVEGLRLLVKFGPSNDRLRLVIEAEPLVYALFALSIFSICSGSYESGMGAMIMLSMRVGWLNELVEIGETVMSQIADIEPPVTNNYRSTYRYPQEDVPNCVYYACTENDVCFECIAYWYSRRVLRTC